MKHEYRPPQPAHMLAYTCTCVCVYCSHRKVVHSQNILLFSTAFAYLILVAVMIAILNGSDNVNGPREQHIEPI